MNVRRVTIHRTSAGFSTADSYKDRVSLPCEPWETPDTKQEAPAEVKVLPREPRHMGPNKRTRERG